MERLGDAIARIRPRLQARIGDGPGEPEPEPNCPICKDFGFAQDDSRRLAAKWSASATQSRASDHACKPA